MGNSIDGTQAEYVRIPFADNGLYLLPPDVDEEAVAMLSCILPTGLECGTLKGHVKPGDIVAIIGAGPVGLATLLTAQLYSPAEIIMIGHDDNRLEVARSFGATKVIKYLSPLLPPVEVVGFARKPCTPIVLMEGGYWATVLMVLKLNT